MRQLIMKDFVVQKRVMPVYLLLAAAFFLFYYSMGDLNLTAIVMPVFIVAYSFMNRSLAEDERNHAMRLLVSLPLYRNQLVRAKYASIALVVFPLFLLLGVAANTMGLEVPGVSASDGDPSGFGIIALVMSINLLIFIIIISIYLPLVFKMGFIKAQTINRFVILFTFALGAGAGALLSRFGAAFGDKGMPGWLQSFTEWLERTNMFVLSAMVLAVAVILYLLSMLLSMRLFERKQLF